MNYKTLSDDELERWAHLGDQNARDELGQRAVELRTEEEVSEAHSEGYDEGHDDGRKAMRSDLSEYANALQEAIKALPESLGAQLEGLLAEIDV